MTGARQRLGDPRAIDGRGHHKNLQVLTQPLLGVAVSARPRSASSERSWNSSNSTAATPSRPARRAEAGEHALGDDLDAGAPRDLRSEPHTVADGVADRFAERLRHALRRGACGEPPRSSTRIFLRRPGLPGQHQRNPRRLAGAGRRHQYGGIASRNVAGSGAPEPRRSAAAAANCFDHPCRLTCQPVLTIRQIFRTHFALPDAPSCNVLERKETCKKLCDRNGSPTAARPVLHATAAARRLGRLRQGLLHHHGGDDAFDPRRRGTAGREGFMHALVAFAKPFRMPLLPDSGLFLSRVIDRDWRTYSTARSCTSPISPCCGSDPVRGQGAAVRRRAWLAPTWSSNTRSPFIEPFGTLWFIYLLAIFFVVDQGDAQLAAARRCGAWRRRCKIAPVQTGWTTIDEFTGRFVYFYTGYLLAPRRSSPSPPWCRRGRRRALLGLLAWALRRWRPRLCGHGRMPVVSLVLGLAGASAVIAVSALMAKGARIRPVRFCGEHSIVIYLAFFLPMAATRTLLLKTGSSRRRRHVAHRHRRRRPRRARHVVGGARHWLRIPVRAARPLLDRAA